MRRIIFTRPDGGLSVVTPVINTLLEHKNFTDADAEQRAWGKLPADAINPRWADAAEIPLDRVFRDAWEDNGGVKVNMQKAREIHRAHLRALRAPLFAALDTEYLRADERGDITAKGQISIKKQALRDVTKDPSIEAAVTPDELVAVVPESLNG